LRQEARNSTCGYTAWQTIDAAAGVASSAAEKQTRDGQRATQSGGRAHESGARCRGIDVHDATIEYIQPSCKVG
jgi:hypothetical protein